MKIKVTDKHILYGKRKSSNQCPIALAIKEATKTHYVYVERDVIRLSYKGDIVHDITPDSANEFIRRYDRKWKVEPFEFELAL